jgi:dethiobiotin synthetase
VRGLFVTGTDTGVGKTVLAAALCAALRAGGERVAAFKPVVTGVGELAAGELADHDLLARCTGQAAADVTPAVFGPALSPHLAAELAQTTLEPEALVDAARACAAGADVLIAEGVGGLLVPLAGRFLVRDLARRLGLPVVIAARPGLGTINHTLSTVEAARAAGLVVRAIVLTPWPAEPSPMERSNARTIAALAGVEVDFLPRVADLEPGALAAAGRELRVERWIAAARSTPSLDVRLDHVVIAVSDWERSNAFYRDVCGAELVCLDEPPPMRWRYRFGSVQLNVHGPGMDPAPVARIPAAPGMADLCFVWPGTADEAMRHLADHTVAVCDGPVRRNGAAGPGTSVYFSDPDGSLLELISYD